MEGATRHYQIFALNTLQNEPRANLCLRQEVGCPPICEMDKCKNLGIEANETLVLGHSSCVSSQVLVLEARRALYSHLS